MKSIKIHSKQINTPRSNFSNQSSYGSLGADGPKATLRQQLAKLVAQVCEKIQSMTPLRLNFQPQIKNWTEKPSQPEEANKVVSEFRKFWLQALSAFLNENSNWELPDLGKAIRIKSPQRIKLRLIKQNEFSSAEMLQEEEAKIQQSTQAQIFELKSANQNLEKKILMLGAQFNQIKKSYEAKIQKLKKLLNSSLMSIYAQLQEGSAGDVITQLKRPSLTNARSEKVIMDSLPATRLKYSNSENVRKFGVKTEKQQSNKFVTVNAIPGPESSKNLFRQLSQQNFRSN